MGACTHIKKMKKKNWTSSPDPPRWGLLLPPRISTEPLPHPHSHQSLERVKRNPRSLPSTQLAGPGGWPAHSQLTGACRLLHGPPPVLQPGGSLHACLDRSITGTPTTPARAQRPCPGLPARMVPDGRRPKPGERDRDCVGEGGGASRRPERTAGPPRPQAFGAPANPAARAQSRLCAPGSPIFILSNPKLGGEHRRRA